MAHFIRIIKTVHLKNKWEYYQKHKENALKGLEDDLLVKTSKESILMKLWKKLKKGFLGKCCAKLRTPNTTANFVAKSFLGFTGGILLTYVFFFFFYLGVSFSLKRVTYICALAGIFLCLGMAFSSKIRCFVFLLLPVFFSKQGRQALMAYALFLAFTGPAKNTMHNMGILSDSLTCSQEMVRNTLLEIYEMIKTPFKSIKEALLKIKKAFNDVIETLKTFVMKIKRITLSILNVIKKAAVWLGSIISFCNKKVGTPFQRCMKTFDDAIADCKAKLGVLDFMCHFVHVIKGLCFTVKWLDFICLFTDFVSDKIVEVVKRKLKEFELHMKNLFYVSIEFEHTYKFETLASNSTKHIARTIVQKISSKVEKFQSVFSFFGFLYSLLFLFVIFKVYYYKYKYLTSDKFDNVYISKYFTDLDLRRAGMGRETVLPLEPREKKKYAKASSLRLIHDEKARMTQSMFLLTLTSFKIISFLVSDYSLFWVLLTIYEAGQDAFEEEEKSRILLHVQGKGVLSDFYRNLGKTLQVPQNPNLRLNPLRCLPDPVAPDTGRYIQIGFLIALCWLLTLTEPYGLRLRNIIMSYYYPDRAKERTIWLYNQILRSRGSFLRYARRQLRRKFQGPDDEPTEKVTLKQKLFASFPLLAALFEENRENCCLLCGVAESKNSPLKRCRTPDCPGKYCINCFATLENICTICQHPIEYGDISDISDEIDSSDEGYYKRTGNNLRSAQAVDTSAPKKFMTFKDLETRDRFIDVESNKKVDYANITDYIGVDKAYVKKKLKQAIKKALRHYIKKIKDEKLKIPIDKDSEYYRIRKEIQKALSKYIEKKVADKPILKYGFELLQGTEESEGSEGSGDPEPPKKSHVSFKLGDVEIPSDLNIQYAEIKNELKKKIKKLRGKKSHSYPSVRTQDQSDDAEPEDNGDTTNNSHLKSLKKSMTYYFVERNRNFNFYKSIPSQLEDISEMLISLDLSDPRNYIL